MTPVQVVIVGEQLPGRVCAGHTEVSVGLQVGKEVVEVFAGDRPTVRWHTAITLGRDPSGVRLARGPALHGPRSERFFYLAWLAASPHGLAMFRRAKLQIDGVAEPLFALLLAEGGTLVGTLPLTAPDGTPVCASVRPPRIVWSASAGSS